MTKEDKKEGKKIRFTIFLSLKLSLSYGFFFGKVGVQVLCGDGAEIPHQAHPGKHHQPIIRDINFPPEKALSGG